MRRLMECVPNVSEGRRRETVEELASLLRACRAYPCSIPFRR